MPKTRHKIIFQGHKYKLAGILSLPTTKPLAYVLFAHCFTCGKDFTASSRISRALLGLGYGVFRFDFTGLGDSEGDFSDTNFSTNVADILAASAYLQENFQAPSLLVGHSLGGTACIKAASQLATCRAVVCISSPATALHIIDLWDDKDVLSLQAKGYGSLRLAGREFLFKKQFLDDLNQQTTHHIRNLNKPLLVMHSPKDEVVAINEAEKIYVKAQHPKSFVSLDNANHLLSNSADTQYVADVIAAWFSRFNSSQ